MNEQLFEDLSSSSSSDWKVSSDAARAMRHIVSYNHKATQALLAVLENKPASSMSEGMGEADNLDNDLNEQARIQAAWSLGYSLTPDIEIQAGLVTALTTDPNWQVREAAAGALGQLGSIASVKPLIEALGDPDEKVCREAAYALYMLGDLAQVSLSALVSGDDSSNIHPHSKNLSSSNSDGVGLTTTVTATATTTNQQVREWAEYALKLFQQSAEVEAQAKETV